jgi:beta-mannosidase
VLLATFGDERGFWFPVEQRDSALTAADLETQVSTTDDGYDVTVTATSLVRDLALLVDKVDVDAVVDDMMVTLLPGDTVTFHVTTTKELASEELTSSSVLRTSNQLVTDWS